MITYQSSPSSYLLSYSHFVIIVVILTASRYYVKYVYTYLLLSLAIICSFIIYLFFKNYKSHFEEKLNYASVSDLALNLTSHEWRACTFPMCLLGVNASMIRMAARGCRPGQVHLIGTSKTPLLSYGQPFMLNMR